jgi:hypothetical protein
MITHSDRHGLFAGARSAQVISQIGCHVRRSIESDSGGHESSQPDVSIKRNERPGRLHDAWVSQAHG